MLDAVPTTSMRYNTYARLNAACADNDALKEILTALHKCLQKMNVALGALVQKQQTFAGTKLGQEKNTALGLFVTEFRKIIDQLDYVDYLQIVSDFHDKESALFKAYQSLRSQQGYKQHAYNLLALLQAFGSLSFLCVAIVLPLGFHKSVGFAAQTRGAQTIEWILFLWVLLIILPRYYEKTSLSKGVLTESAEQVEEFYSVASQFFKTKRHGMRGLTQLRLRDEAADELYEYQTWKKTEQLALLAENKKYLAALKRVVEIRLSRPKPKKPAETKSQEGGQNIPPSDEEVNLALKKVLTHDASTDQVDGLKTLFTFLQRSELRNSSTATEKELALQTELTQQELSLEDCIERYDIKKLRAKQIALNAQPDLLPEDRILNEADIIHDLEFPPTPC